MAEIRTVKVCDDTCGCAVPCPGGASCRCTTITATATATATIGAGGEVRHNLCSCGHHCGCHPCTCGKNFSSMGVGKSDCTCGTGCTCAACAAA